MTTRKDAMLFSQKRLAEELLRTRARCIPSQGTLTARWAAKRFNIGTKPAPAGMILSNATVNFQKGQAILDLSDAEVTEKQGEPVPDSSHSYTSTTLDSLTPGRYTIEATFHNDQILVSFMRMTPTCGLIHRITLNARHQ